MSLFVRRGLLAAASLPRLQIALPRATAAMAAAAFTSAAPTFPARLASSRVGPPSMSSEHVPTILFIECGFGCDQHGQTSTKAAVRACRNAIEFNSLPRIGKLVPGGYDGMKLHVQLGVPEKYTSDVDQAAVRAVFPYGDIRIDIEPGGLLADSGIALEKMGDKNRDMIIAVACVTVGY